MMDRALDRHLDRAIDTVATLRYCAIRGDGRGARDACRELLALTNQIAERVLTDKPSEIDLTTEEDSIGLQ